MERYETDEATYEAQSSITKRKSLGQFFTPYPVAIYMVDLLLQSDKEEERILDPAAGLSIFQRVVENRKINRHTFYSYEKDSDIYAVNKAKNHFSVLNEDYLFAPLRRDFYTKIIANPPYIKHINIPDKKTVYAHFCQTFGIKMPVSSNYYCYFIIKAIEELAPGGRAVFIVPGELFSSNYGIFFKEYILKKNILKAVYFFKNENIVFRDAISTPMIILLEKVKNSSINFFQTEFTISSSVQTTKHIELKYTQVSPTDKWKNYLRSDVKDIAPNDFSSLPLFNNKYCPFTNYASIHRGIATGANSFFIFSENKRNEKRIDKRYFVYCLTAADLLHGITFKRDFLKENSGNENILLLNLTGYDGSDAAVNQYIAWGETQGFQNKYLTSHRTPWYSMEPITCIGDMFITTFSRTGFRVILNEAHACNLTCVHSITFKDPYKKYILFFFAYFQTALFAASLKLHSREHGNGLTKVEPKDVEKTMLPNISLFSEKEINDISKKILLFIEDQDVRLLNEIEVFFSSRL